MRYLFILLLILTCNAAFNQTTTNKLNVAMQQLSNDAQFKHAAISMYVVDSKTGAVVFDKNSELGMAPASCLKVITSASAFELLGKEYKYKTTIYLDGNIENKILNGRLIVHGQGDPTLGSWRYESTKENVFFELVSKALLSKQVSKIQNGVSVVKNNFDVNNIPKGWSWEDIGNYYGAGVASVNWHENQYDLILNSGQNIGDAVEIKRFEPDFAYMLYANHLTTAAKGTGDNAYIFFAVNNTAANFSGTIPIGEKDFKISGAVPDPLNFFEKRFNSFLQKNKYLDSTRSSLLPGQQNEFVTKRTALPANILTEYFSPPLDSINYWFLKKSINLYGEAFVKTIAFEKTKTGSTEVGVNIIKEFWKDKGIDPAAINIIDGSGLSPANRVTTNALVTVMQYAKQQPWFASFYYDLPEANGIKMKDGYITGVRSYTGYIKSADGKDYTFSFIINNFDGSAGTAREKMWRVLDIMK